LVLDLTQGLTRDLTPDLDGVSGVVLTHGSTLDLTPVLTHDLEEDFLSVVGTLDFLFLFSRESR